MPTIGTNRTGADTEPPSYDSDDGLEPRRRDVDRLFRSQDFPMPEGLRAEVHDVAERLFGAPAEAPFKPGDRLGGHRIVRLLGAGGQAWVYEARHEKLDRRVALKVPRADVAERLIREARLTAPLEHPHIVRVEDIEADGEVPYLVMECCAGGSLDTLLERYPGGLPLPDVRAIARATLEALEFAHRRGIVHRDVKPANILFDGRGTPKLGDLGIGLVPRGDADLQHSVGLSQASQAPMGTPLYVAPEQEDPSRLKGGTLDGRADLFSFGKTLFVMLTGASPRTIRPPSRLRPGLNAAWDDFLFKLVEEARDRRFASATDALAALARIPDAAPAPIVVTPAEVAAVPVAVPILPDLDRRGAGGVYLLGGLASAGFVAWLEVVHTTARLGPAWPELAPLKLGAILCAGFLLYFRRLDRAAAHGTSAGTALLLSLLLAGWAPALYAARALHALSRPDFQVWAPIVAGTMTALGLGCATFLFGAPSRRRPPEIRVRPRTPRGPVSSFVGALGRIVATLAGLTAAAVSAIVAGVAVVVVIVAANLRGWGLADGHAGLAGTGLMLLASAAATFAVILVAAFLRRTFRRAGDEED